MILLLFVQLAMAWEFDYPKYVYFPQDEIKINVSNQTSCENLNLDHQDLLKLAVESANTYWNSVKNSKLRFIKGKVVDRKGYGLDQDYSMAIESEILIGCDESSIYKEYDWDAYGGLRFEEDKITKAFISLDASDDSNLVRYSKQEWLNLLAHEMGHTIGFAHNDNRLSIMYARIQSDFVQLHLEDRQALSSLYPNN